MNSNKRTLEIFCKLLKGSRISVDALTQDYECNKRTIQRDLTTIKNSAVVVDKKLIHDQKMNEYFFDTPDANSPEEVLLICKILLESRSLTKAEMDALIQKLCSTLSNENQLTIKNFLANEGLQYTPLAHQKNLLKEIWKFMDYISHKTVLAFEYRNNRGDTSARKGLPVSLFFSEYYFYVLIYNSDYQKYLTYRLDRFIDVTETTEKINIPHKDRLEDGELRKKIHFMYVGRETTFTFRFWGIREAALDKLPHSKIIKEHEDDSVDIEAVAYDTGVIMWLLSQGSNVQVLSPPSLVEKIQQEIENMQKRYR